MQKPNAIIEALKLNPCIAEDLPYKPSANRFGIENRMLMQKIHVNAHKYRKGQPPHRPFITVYYIIGDIDRAVDLFVEVNRDALSALDFTGNNLIHSGLPKNVAKKIVMKAKTFKVLKPKGL